MQRTTKVLTTSPEKLRLIGVHESVDFKRLSKSAEILLPLHAARLTAFQTAPSSLSRTAVQPLLDAAEKMARHLKYKGLGTFEFLFNAQTFEWVFLEINPRIQVEHTVTG